MNKKGVALLLALFTLTFVSMLVVTFIDITTSDLQITANHLARNKALYIADAGIEYVISRLITSRDPTLNSPTQLPSGSGNSYAVTYDRNSGIINAIGTLSSGERVILGVKVSVTGSNSPFKVRIINWKEL